MYWLRLPLYPFWIDNRAMVRKVVLFAIFLLAVPAPAKQKEFLMPKAYPAATYPAHDIHENEGFGVAADPYDLPEKTSIFAVDYKKEGLLPIFVVFTNNGDRPVSLVDMDVVFITHSRTRIRPDSADDIFRKIAEQKSSPGQPSRLPIPLPRRKAKPNVKREYQDEVNDSQFMARMVEPHATRAGFFYFDVDGIEDPLAGAKLEFTGIRNADGQELFFFEIPMEKYLNYNPNK